MVIYGLVTANFPVIGDYNMIVTCLIPDSCVDPCPNPEETMMSGVTGIGLADADWTVTPPNQPATQAIVSGIASGSGWPLAYAGSNWISVTGSGIASPGIYYFEHQFMINSNCQNPTLTLCIQVDELATLFINGAVISNIHHFETFTLTNSPFFVIGGTNTITLKVFTSLENFLGINVKGWLCCDFPKGSVEGNVLYRNTLQSPIPEAMLVLKDGQNSIDTTVPG